MTAQVYNGLCRQGPLDGKVRAMQTRTFKPEGNDAGLYVHRLAQGPTPAVWLWIPAKKEAMK